MRLLFTAQPASLAALAALLQPQRGRDLEKSRRKALKASSSSLGVGAGRRWVERHCPTRRQAPALGDPEPLLEDDDGPPTAIRGYQFPRFNSFNMSMSSAWSATIFLRRVFSFSSSLSLFASSVFMPPYWLPAEQGIGRDEKATSAPHRGSDRLSAARIARSVVR